MMFRARTGAALVMALLLLVVLDCIVLGTLHISMQEHRIGQNRQGVLQLRLNAESALRAVAGSWPPLIDSLDTGGRTALPAPSIAGALVNIERLGDQLFLLDAIAVEPAPRAGRAAARMLVHPPVLPRDTDPAPAPLSAAGAVRVLPTGAVSAGSRACEGPPPEYAILLANTTSAIVEPGGVVDAPIGTLPRTPLSSDFERVAALSAGRTGVQLTSGDTAIGQVSEGILIVNGDLTLEAGARFQGLLIVRGDITVALGSFIAGAAHAGDAVVVGGEIRGDPCLVQRAVDAARFRSAAPVGGRAWLPAFGG